MKTNKTIILQDVVTEGTALTAIPHPYSYCLNFRISLKKAMSE
jgi:hypothetical protein